MNITPIKLHHVIFPFSQFQFLRWQLVLLSSIRNVDAYIFQLSDANLTSVLIFGKTLFDKYTNTLILEATMEYLIKLKDLMNCYLIILKQSKSIMPSCFIMQTIMPTVLIKFSKCLLYTFYFRYSVYLFFY